MRLFLFRHADASYDAPDDSSRELSAKGIRSLETLTRKIRLKEFEQLSEIRHSPYIRASSTARLFREKAGLQVPCRVMAGLCPEDDPIPAVDEFMQYGGDLMIVGHNPNLTFLASYLLTGSSSNTAIIFKKAGMVSLERVGPATPVFQGGQWALNWYVFPKVLNTDPAEE